MVVRSGESTTEEMKPSRSESAARVRNGSAELSPKGTMKMNRNMAALARVMKKASNALSTTAE